MILARNLHSLITREAPRTRIKPKIYPSTHLRSKARCQVASVRVAQGRVVHWRVLRQAAVGQHFFLSCFRRRCEFLEKSIYENAQIDALMSIWMIS